MKPYTELKNTHTVERIFTPDVDEQELVWHRDRKDREVRVIGDTDWMFQFDNELPQLLKNVIFIPRNTYHRVIKGTTNLTVHILED